MQWCSQLDSLAHQAEGTDRAEDPSLGRHRDKAIFKTDWTGSLLCSGFRVGGEIQLTLTSEVQVDSELRLSLTTVEAAILPELDSKSESHMLCPRLSESDGPGRLSLSSRPADSDSGRQPASAEAASGQPERQARAPGQRARSVSDH